MTDNVGAVDSIGGVVDVVDPVVGVDDPVVGVVDPTTVAVDRIRIPDVYDDVGDQAVASNASDTDGTAGLIHGEAELRRHQRGLRRVGDEVNGKDGDEENGRDGTRYMGRTGRGNWEGRGRGKWEGRDEING